MPGFLLSGRLGLPKLIKATKNKISASETQEELDWERVDFDPREFNPFDQPDMALTPEGRPTITSRLDPYSVVEDPNQTLSQYLNLNLNRRKTIRATSRDGEPITRAPRKEPGKEPRSFERISGYHVQRSGQLNPGPSHPRIQQLRPSDRYITDSTPHHQNPQRIERNGRLCPLSRKIFVPEGNREAGSERFTHPVVHPPRMLHRVSGSRHLRGGEPRNQEPIFDGIFSRLWGGSGTQLGASAERILKSQEHRPAPKSLTECPRTHIKRHTYDITPDCGRFFVSTDAQDSKHSSVDGKAPRRAIHTQQESGCKEDPSQENSCRGRSLSKQKRRYCSLERSNSWLDCPEGRRGRVLTRTSSNEPNKRSHASSTERYQQWHSRELKKEPENGGRFKAILNNQDDLKAELTEGHLQRILDAARHGAPPATTLDLWASFTGGKGHGNRKWIRQKVPVRIHDVKELKYVSHMQWTPGIEAIMTSALTAEVRDAGDVKVTLVEMFRMKRNKWFKKGKLEREDGDGIVRCPTGSLDPGMCQRRRLKRFIGGSGGIC